MPDSDARVTETLMDLQERVMPQLQQAKERLEGLNDTAKKFLKERPGTCLLAAIGAGFLIGRMASRR